MAAPRKENIKEIITSTMEKIIERENLSDITLAEIATMCKISKGTLYYHYKSKDEILLDVTDRYLTQQVIDIEAWTNDKTKDTSIHRMTMYVIERAIISSSMRIHLTYEALQGNNNIREKLISRYNSFITIIADKIRARTTTLDGDFYAWLILVLCDGISVQLKLENKNFDVKKFVDNIINLSKHLEK